MLDDGCHLAAADSTFDGAVLVDAAKKWVDRRPALFEPRGHQIAGALGCKRQPSHAKRIIFAAADDQAKRPVRALLNIVGHQ
jgi:hypothetical protein